MELTVDGRPCDLASGGGRLPVYDAAELIDPVSRREGSSLRLALPPTVTNRELFDGWTAERFNAQSHEALLTAGGESLMRGTVRLLESSGEGFCIEIRGGAAQWAKRVAVGLFHAIPLTWEGRLTPTEICASWTSASAVKFLPVHRDAYETEPSSTGLEAVRRILSTRDYHPFLQIDALLRAIFADAGYTVESRFMEGNFFRSLYMSGAYPRVDIAALERRMGFFARRKAEASAAADAYGRVYASPHVAVSSVGNFVDAFLPGDTDAEGNPLTDVYARSGCFTLEEGRILFRPVTDVKVGFEFRVRFVTDYRILSRERLRGFDSAYLGSGVSVFFALTNRFEDRRGAVTGGYRYRVVVFAHREGASYRLVDTTAAGGNRVLGTFASRSTLIATAEGAVGADPVLQIFTDGVWRGYDDDWALYDGYIGETGSLEAEVVLSTPPERVTPAAPRDFRTLYFYGAEPGMNFTLKQPCVLRPLFSQVPGEGSKLTFAEVAAHSVRQSVLVDAVVHLFNLRIFTDEQAKCVFIEPEADFYDRGRLFDWSGRIETSVPVRVSDRALEEHESRRYGYLPGEGAAARADKGQESLFGQWVSVTDSRAARQGEQAVTSPLFAPTVGVAGCVAGAPSALLPDVGDRDAAGDEEDFTPRIVSFRGLRPLPAGERWGYPAPAGSYPLAGFHMPDEGLTLCFEDRDGAVGLHTRYDGGEERRSYGQILTLRLRLSPGEVAALQHRSDGVNAGIDSLFLLRVGGVPHRCILRSVKGYDPESERADCVFETLVGETP